MLDQTLYLRGRSPVAPPFFWGGCSMSMKHMARVWEMTGVQATDKLVLLALADYTPPGDESVSVRLEKLAEKCGLSGRTAVRKVLKRLEENGHIKIIHERREDGGWGAATYQLLITHDSNSVIPHDSKKVMPYDSNSVIPMTPTEWRDDSHGVEGRLPGSHAHNIISNQEFNQEFNLLAQSEKLLDWFEKIFWIAWPKKINKKPCWQQVKKLNPDFSTREKILSAIPKHAASVSDLQFLCSPDRWIRDHRWEDEVVPFSTGVKNSKPSARDEIARRQQKRRESERTIEGKLA